jgi:AcrR family transcriptional regulator
MSSLPRRTPQQDRGERRVGEILDAASGLIAEVGYDAATLTAFAERAGSSIGALYQYFPNKEAIARALRQRYGDEMEARWAPLLKQGGRLSLITLVDQIIDVMTEFMEQRPAYIPLQSATGNYRRDPAAKNRLRGLFVKLLQNKRPALSPEAALRIANVMVQAVKGMYPLYAEADAAERRQLVHEYKLLLVSYLTARLDA